MAKYFDYIGLVRDASNAVAVDPYTPATSKAVAEKYLEYLKEFDHYQKDRRTTIENKNSQLVGQASIVTSIFSLFVPLLIDKFNDFSFWISFSFCVLFLVIMFHYLLTIFHAIRTLKIDKYRYPTRSTTSITKAQRANTELDFINSEIEDLIFIVNKSTPIDNDKGQNLIFATRCFEIANFGFGILTVAIIISTFFFKKETPEVKVKNLNEIHLVVPDTMNNRIINLQKLDTTIKVIKN